MELNLEEFLLYNYYLEFYFFLKRNIFVILEFKLLNILLLLK